jgi:hypothetical protein
MKCVVASLRECNVTVGFKLLLRPLIDLLYEPRMIVNDDYDDDCGVICGMNEVLGGDLSQGGFIHKFVIT